MHQRRRMFPDPEGTYWVLCTCGEVLGPLPPHTDPRRDPRAKRIKAAKPLISAHAKEEFGASRHRSYPSGLRVVFQTETQFTWWCVHCHGTKPPVDMRNYEGKRTPEACFDEHAVQPGHQRKVGLLTPEVFASAAAKDGLTRREEALKRAREARG